MSEENNKVEPNQVSVEDKAAFAFKNLMPIWKRSLRSLSKKASERVINSVIEFPLAELEPKFQNAKEQELFQIGITILEANKVMTEAVIRERFIKSKEQETKKGEENGETNKETVA